MKRAALILTTAAVCAACTPAQVADMAGALGIDLPPEQATLVAATFDRPLDCNDAIAVVWPPRLQAWARRIVWRESRNDPRARNKRSTASGCFQLLAMHADLFAAIGCSWVDRFDPLANTRAAWALYQGSGSNPWRATR